MTVIEWVEQLDKTIFSFIQTRLSAPWLDGIMISLRTPYTWIPLYIFMFVWILKFEKPVLIKFIVGTIICFAMTDYITSHFLKPFFERMRPCHNADLQSCIRGIVDCGGKYSFPSSHAANHFGLASFWFFSIRYMRNKKWNWLWIWALLISYAQVYVGVHFPLDVIAGAFIGILFGFSLFIIFKKWTNYPPVSQSKSPVFSLH